MNAHTRGAGAHASRWRGGALLVMIALVAAASAQLAPLQAAGKDALWEPGGSGDVGARFGNDARGGHVSRGGDDRGDAELAIELILGRAVSANQDLIYAGSLTVATFSEWGPQISEIDLHRDRAGVRIVRDGDEFGRADGIAFGPTSSDELLQIGGVERVPTQLERMQQKYAALVVESVALDTGPALPVQLAEHATGTVREVLFLDDETGLIVRRETFSRTGEPVRVVAYTSLEVVPEALQTPVSVPANGVTVTTHDLALEDAQSARAAGFEVPETLPRGYELVALFEMPDTSVPTLHLMYSDGLYTVSVFQQLGQLKRDAVDGAAWLTTADGGVVWRWPGTEPRRLLFTGDGTTFTVLADAPTDELIDVVSGLPIDPEPSTLDRLAQGVQRFVGWFGRSNDRSVT